MTYLRALQRIKTDEKGSYPFHLECINHIETFNLDSDVSIFIGENGTGKTTFLESLVHLTGIVNLIPMNSDGHNGPRVLSKSFKAIWNHKTNKGFYLKSQSFISYVNQMDQIKKETQQERSDLIASYKHRSEKALNLALIPYNRSLHEMNDQYGVGLHNMSHGEGYLELFKSRLVPNGLYILDEPELSLSPMRQLSLISLIKKMVNEGCQFIIITHSPILMAYENAVIYDFNESNIKEIAYNDIEHVNLTKDFLNCPERYLKHL